MPSRAELTVHISMRSPWRYVYRALSSDAVTKVVAALALAGRTPVTLYLWLLGIALRGALRIEVVR